MAGTEVRGISWRRGAEARGAKLDFLQIFLNLGHKNQGHVEILVPRQINP